ncbi:MAG: hypothetical protein JRG75_07885 [Deltaproteobacteria bacterium]|nr:hypothetical protein [Deltaproteobacteria bacterium]
MKPNKEFDYFDKPETIKKLWILLYVVCGLLVVPDFFTHRHPYFGFDGFFGFYALLGFVSCVVLILFSKLVGLVLKVKEDYYDD